MQRNGNLARIYTNIKTLRVCLKIIGNHIYANLIKLKLILFLIWITGCSQTIWWFQKTSAKIYGSIETWRIISLKLIPYYMDKYILERDTETKRLYRSFESIGHSPKLNKSLSMKISKGVLLRVVSTSLNRYRRKHSGFHDIFNKQMGKIRTF